MRITSTNNTYVFYELDKASRAWSRDTASPATNNEWNAAMDSYSRKKLAKITPHIIEKPDWFRTSERRARRFVRSLGFEAAKGAQIMCVNPDTNEANNAIFDCGLDGLPFAVTISHIGVVMPYKETKHQYEYGGDIAVTPTIVHELIHAIESIDTTIAATYDKVTDEFIGYSNRQGLQLSKLGEYNGAILNEIPCELAAGLYVRRQHDPSAVLCSIEDKPQNKRPAHYSTNAPKLDGTPSQTGNEAYAAEMLSWKAHQLGITATKNVLLEEFFASRSNDTDVRLRALRAIPRIINGVEPGLYKQLRAIADYNDRANMMANVYDIVTK